MTEYQLIHELESWFATRLLKCASMASYKGDIGEEHRQKALKELVEIKAFIDKEINAAEKIMEDTGLLKKWEDDAVRLMIFREMSSEKITVPKS